MLFLLPNIKAYTTTDHSTTSFYVDHSETSETTEFYDYDYSDDDETTTYVEYEYLDYENTIDLEKREENPDLEKEDDQADLEKKDYTDYTHYGLIDKLGGEEAKSKGHQPVMRFGINCFILLIAFRLLQYISF